MNSGAQELFREACGFQARLEFDVVGPGGESSRHDPLDRPFALIGRDRRNDLRLDGATVSPRHAYLQVISGRPFVVDLGSRSGTRWQDQARNQGWLGPADMLGIGDCSVRLASNGTGVADDPATSAPNWNPLEADSGDQPPLPLFNLEFGGGSANAACRRLDRALTLVGRASSCALRLLDHTVSPFHCALLRTAHGLWMVDLIGKGGVWVNGRQMRWARLEDEARLQVGCFSIRVWHQRPTHAAPAGQFLEALSIGEQRTAGGDHCLDGSGAIRRGSDSLGGSTELVPVVTELSQATPMPGGLVPLSPLPFASFPPHLGAVSLPAVMMHQLATLQQQMLAQFQQSMLMMAQMMTALRHEEMELLREVLERLGGLKQEVVDLTAKEKKRAARRTRRKRGAAEEPATEAGTSAAGESLGQVIDSIPPTEAGSTNGDAAPPPSFADGCIDPNFHAWLSGRIATLDKDRQGAWRKLLALVIGK